MTELITQVSTHEEQVNLFAQMLNRTRLERLLTIEAPCGLGKSHLLRQMGRHAESNGYRVICIDLRHTLEMDSLYLIRHLRDSLAVQGRDIFQQLNRIINRYTRSLAVTVGIKLNGRIQNVCVDQHALLSNLLNLEMQQLKDILLTLGIYPSYGNKFSKRRLADFLLNQSLELKLLADLVTLAQQIKPAVNWWQAIEQSPLELSDQQGDLWLNDRFSRQQAIGEMSQALMQAVGEIAKNQLLLIMIDSWDEGGQTACGWLEQWLIQPAAANTLPGVNVVVAGRNLAPLRSAGVAGLHTDLEPLSEEQIKRILFNQFGFSEQTDTAAIYEWTKGFPSVLATLIGVNQLKDGSIT